MLWCIFQPSVTGSWRSYPSCYDVFFSQVWPVPGDPAHHAMMYFSAKCDRFLEILPIMLWCIFQPSVTGSWRSYPSCYDVFFSQVWPVPGDLTHHAMMYFSAKCDRFLEILPIMLWCTFQPSVTGSWRSCPSCCYAFVNQGWHADQLFCMVLIMVWCAFTGSCDLLIGLLIRILVSVLTKLQFVFQPSVTCWSVCWYCSWWSCLWWRWPFWPTSIASACCHGGSLDLESSLGE